MLTVPAIAAFTVGVLLRLLSRGAAALTVLTLFTASSIGRIACLRLARSRKWRH